MKRVSLWLALCACNTYQFVPVEPCSWWSSARPITVASRPGKPNLFLLVDKSGSMKFTTSADPMCASCVSSSCSIAGCPTRWDGLTAAMHTFLPSAATQAHLGMVPFPVGDPAQAALQCNAAQLSDIASAGVPLDSSADSDTAGMQATANAVQAKIDAIDPSGGTPTGASVSMLGSYDPLVHSNGRASFVVLLTDGVPNCDPALDANSCTCTQASTPCSANVGGATLNLCLDDTATAQAIDGLRANQGVRTIVVGFGNDTLGGVAPGVLQSLGQAGGFNRPCTQDADCGAGDTCSRTATGACGQTVQACARSYYQATDAASLATALDSIRGSIGCWDPCVVTLNDAPTDPRLLAVEFNGQPMHGGQADTYAYDPATASVTFQGAACNQLKASTTENPVKLEFRVAEPTIADQAGCAGQ